MNNGNVIYYTHSHALKRQIRLIQHAYNAYRTAHREKYALVRSPRLLALRYIFYFYFLSFSFLFLFFLFVCLFLLLIRAHIETQGIRERTIDLAYPHAVAITRTHTYKHTQQIHTYVNSHIHACRQAENARTHVTLRYVTFRRAVKLAHSERESLARRREALLFLIISFRS